MERTHSAAASSYGRGVTYARDRESERERDNRVRERERRKLTELCGELDTLGERCTVTNAMTMMLPGTAHVSDLATSFGTTLARHCSRARTYDRAVRSADEPSFFAHL